MSSKAPITRATTRTGYVAIPNAPKIKERIKGKKLNIRQISKKTEQTKTAMPITARLESLFPGPPTFLSV